MRTEEIDGKKTRVITRRRFVQGIAAGTALLACWWKERKAFGESAPPDSAVLTGTHFDLTIDTIPVNFTGRPSRASAVNGSTPGPTLRWREGDAVTISLISSELRAFFNRVVRSGMSAKQLKTYTLEADGIALFLSRWSLQLGTQGIERTFVATTVFRRQPDGGWRVLIDNSVGPSVLDS